MENLIENVSAGLSSFVKDTWKKECIEDISIHNFKPMFTDSPRQWTSTIKFVNGNTSSKQEFRNVDLKALISEMEAFLKTLK